jgi:hypothetical protein
MNRFRAYALALLSAIAINAYAQKGIKREQAFNIPPIQDFSVEYDHTVHAFLTGSEGPITWQSRTYATEGKDPAVSTEIRGHIDVDVDFAGFVGVDKIYAGFVTTIDRKNQTIESIVYSNGKDESNLSQYDKALAVRQNIDTAKADDISHWIIDYKKRHITNLEKASDTSYHALPDTLTDIAVGFQEGYFLLPKTIGSDTTMNIYYEKLFPIQSQVREDDDGKPMIYLDLTLPDPENPGERKNIMSKLKYLKIYTSRDGLPETIFAGSNTMFGLVEVEANRKDPED